MTNLLISCNAFNNIRNNSKADTFQLFDANLITYCFDSCMILGEPYTNYLKLITEKALHIQTGRDRSGRDNTAIINGALCFCRYKIR